MSEDEDVSKLTNTQTLEKMISQLRNYIIQYQPVKLLNILNFYYLLQINNRKSKWLDAQKTDTALKLFQYVLAVYESTDIINYKNLKAPEYDDVIEIIDSFSTLLNGFSECEMDSISSSFLNNDLVFGQQLREKVDGKTYACFAEPIVEMLLQTQGALFEQIYNLSLESLNLGLRQLAKTTLVLPVANIDQLVGKTFQEVFPHIEKISPIERFDVKSNTNWPNELICDLSCEIGGDKEFFQREQYPGHLDVEMPVYKHPFIRYDGVSYCFSHNLLFDHLYRNFRKALVNREKSVSETWNINQKNVSEGIIAEMFMNTLKGAKVYTNNYYRADSNWSENDIIVDFFNYFFIIEVKAGSYTPRSVVMDPLSHDAAVKGLIDVPFDQTNRTEEYIKSVKEPVFYDSDHKEKFRLMFEGKAEIIKLAISIDALGEISAGINYNGHNQTPENPVIALSIHDLNVYCHFFDSPIFFLHFFLKRRKISNNRVLIDDELNYLGAYLANQDYIEFFNAQESDMHIILTNLYEDVDIYFSSFMQKKLKPKFGTDLIVTKCIYKLPIDCCGVQIGIQLLNLNSEQQLKLVANFQHIIRRQKQTDHFSQVLMKPTDESIYPIAVFCNQDKRCATEYKAHEQATAIAESYCFNSVLYFIVDWGKWPSIKKVICGKAIRTEKAEYESCRFAQLVDHINHTGREI